jgi:hypothetical protein
MTGEKSEKKFPDKNLSDFRRKIGGFPGLGMTTTVEPCPLGAAQTVQGCTKSRVWCQLTTP